MSDMCTDNHMDAYSSADKFFSECCHYKNCNKNKDDLCDNPKCQYSIHILSQNSYFKCGRRR